MVMLMLNEVIKLFTDTWGQILFGLFAVGLSFFIGKTISNGAFISFILLLALWFMTANLMFLAGGLLCLIIGLVSKQGGV